MNKIVLIIGGCALLLVGCQSIDRDFTESTIIKPKYDYTLTKSVAVNGRQGVASEGDYYWISGSASLAKYDKTWNLVAVNEAPFASVYVAEVNHIGDIDVYNNEIYCGVELFLDGVASNIQFAIYDGNADLQEADHIYRAHIIDGAKEVTVKLVKSLSMILLIFKKR